MVQHPYTLQVIGDEPYVLYADVIGLQVVEVRFLVLPTTYVMRTHKYNKAQYIYTQYIFSMRNIFDAAVRQVIFIHIIYHLVFESMESNISPPAWLPLATPSVASTLESYRTRAPELGTGLLIRAR